MMRAAVVGASVAGWTLAVLASSRSGQGQRHRRRLLEAEDSSNEGEQGLAGPAQAPCLLSARRARRAQKRRQQGAPHETVVEGFSAGPGVAAGGADAGISEVAAVVQPTGLSFPQTAHAAAHGASGGSVGAAAAGTEGCMRRVDWPALVQARGPCSPGIPLSRSAQRVLPALLPATNVDSLLQ